MSKGHRHVLVFAEYYYPDEAAASARIMTEMAEDMTAAGSSVDGVCGYPSYLRAVRARTQASLEHCRLRYDSFLLDHPRGEWIVINDTKPRGLETAVAFNVPRDRVVQYGDYLTDWTFRRPLRSSLGMVLVSVCYALTFPGFLWSWLRIWSEYGLTALVRSGEVPFVCGQHLGGNFLLTASAGEYCKTYGFTGVIVLALPSQVALLQRMPVVAGAIASHHPIPYNVWWLMWLAGHAPFSRCVLASSVLSWSGGY